MRSWTAGKHAMPKSMIELKPNGCAEKLSRGNEEDGSGDVMDWQFRSEKGHGMVTESASPDKCFKVVIFPKIYRKCFSIPSKNFNSPQFINVGKETNSIPRENEIQAL